MILLVIVAVLHGLPVSAFVSSKFLPTCQRHASKWIDNFKLVPNNELESHSEWVTNYPPTTTLESTYLHCSAFMHAQSHLFWIRCFGLQRFGYS